MARIPALVNSILGYSDLSRHHTRILKVDTYEIPEYMVREKDSFKIQMVISLNIQLQRAYKKYDLTAIHLNELYRLASLDYGQRWLGLNIFLNNKHLVIK